IRQDTIALIEGRIADGTMTPGMSRPSSLKYITQLTGFDMEKRIAYVVSMKYVDRDGCLITEDNTGPIIVQLDSPKEDSRLLGHVAEVIDGRNELPARPDRGESAGKNGKQPMKS